MKTSNKSSHIKSLEIDLHNSVNRAGYDKLNALLHEEFMEIGWSGVFYAKADILNDLPQERQASQILAWDFKINFLAMDIALVTYASCHVLANGAREKHALRSSLWQHSVQGWKIRFHQGTPAASLS